MKYSERLKHELESSKLEPIFEFSVINKDTGENDWITCNIFINETSDQIIAQRDGVSKAELQSPKIATTRIDIEDCFSLDEHLQSLFEAILEDILKGGLFELAED